MLKSLIQILDKIGCHHDWEVWRENRVNGGYGREYSVLHLNCKKCGKLKRIKSS